MDIRTRQVGDVLVTDIVGRLDSRSAGFASATLNEIVQGGHPKIVLNLAGLDFVTSAGLRAILVAAKLLQAHDGAMTICCANAAVTQVMEFSGMHSLLKLYDTEDAACAACAVS